MFPSFRIGFFCLWCSLVSANSAQGETTDVEQLAALLSAIEWMQADFQQEVRDSQGELVDQSSGWLAWHRPDNFRWEVQEPMLQSIVIRGDTYYQYDRDLEQLVIEPLSRDIAVLPTILLSGDSASISENYKVVRAAAGTQQDAVDVSRFILYPLDPDSLFSQVTLEFTEGQLTLLNIADDLAQQSAFRLSARPDAKVPMPTLFVLEPGPNTDIIHP